MSSQLAEMHHYTVCTILCLHQWESCVKQYCTTINKINVLYTTFYTTFKEQTELECKLTTYNTCGTDQPHSGCETYHALSAVHTEELQNII